MHFETSESRRRLQNLGGIELRCTTGGTGTRFGLNAHHANAAREWPYDRKSAFGKLDRAFDTAPKAIDMKNEWKEIPHLEANERHTRYVSKRRFM
jgi:hypothetical protein